MQEAFEQLKPKENNMNDSAMPEAAAIPNPQSQRQDYVMGNFPQALHSTAPPQNRRSHSASITHCDNSNQSLPLDGSDDEVATVCVGWYSIRVKVCVYAGDRQRRTTCCDSVNTSGR